MVFLRDRGQAQDAEAVQPCCTSPPPCCGFLDQERGCKTNHSCNMRESTWRLWRSLKTLLAPGFCRGTEAHCCGWLCWGSLLWVAMPGLRSCRTCIAMSQGQHKNTVGHFSVLLPRGNPILAGCAKACLWTAPSPWSLWAAQWC